MLSGGKRYRPAYTILLVCDTMVAVGESTGGLGVVFGKNSDRPDEEVQFVNFVPRMRPEEEFVTCTHVRVPQVKETAAVLLSRPYWMWGAEMGANEHGVVAGNEAVWTKEPLGRGAGLLGMDLLRLGLERGRTARQVLDAVAGLLERYGQGGPCTVHGDMFYHNSFLFADASEAWVLETAGQWWVAERVAGGVRNISNGLSVTGLGDLRREGVVEHAVEAGYCRDDADFNFAACFSAGGHDPEPGPYTREGRCRMLLRRNDGRITPALVTQVLRDHEAGVCMHGGFLSAGSQVSLLSPRGAVHFFQVVAPPCAAPYLPFEFDGSFDGFGPTERASRVDPRWPWARFQAALRRRGAAVARALAPAFERERRWMGAESVPELVGDHVKLREINLATWKEITAVLS
ncbi:MAG: dipeptidase [Promethearchaeota archaeon]